MPDYSTAAIVRIEPHGPIWPVMVFDAENNYLGGADTAVGYVSEREQKLEVHQMLVRSLHLNPGEVDTWELGDGRNYLLEVVPL